MTHIGIKRKTALGRAFFAAALLCVVFASRQGYSATESGTRILNQAAATYLDTNGVAQDVISNQVETLIRQVAGLDLVLSQSKPAIRNGQVVFPHVLTNTGNGADTYEICIANEAGSFSFDQISIYADEDRDGLPDSSTQLQDTDFDGCFDIGPVSSGEAFSFAIVAETPDIIATNQTAQFEVTATSDFDSLLSVTNLDDAVLIEGPLIEVVKVLSANTAYAGTGGYSVTLEYRNVGTEAATDLLITDLLPTSAADGSTGDSSQGMIYSPGTASWQQGDASNLSASSIAVLTDTDDADVQTSSGVNVIYCAYASDSSCLVDPFGNDQMTIQIDTVPVGAIGRITFDFSLDSGYEDNAVLNNFVEFEYLDSLGVTSFGSYVSNTASLVITEEVDSPGVVANNSNTDINAGVNDANDSGNLVTASSTAQGASVSFSNYIWNASANGVDTFDISLDTINDREDNPLVSAFPLGTSFTLLREDGQTPLQDTDGNGAPDTGPLDSGDFAEVVLRVTMPPDTTGLNLDWAVTLVAASVADSSITNAVTNQLASVDNSTVDLTNSADGTAGSGPYVPGSSPVTIEVVAPTETAAFALWIENTGLVADSFELGVSDQYPFVSGSFPVDWQVGFYADGGSSDCSILGAAASTSFVVLPGTGNKRLICASITVPAQTSPQDQDVFFRVISDATGAEDIKLDRVTVSAEPNLIIQYDQSGQLQPGDSVVYSHVISNIGNQDLECVNVNLTSSQAAEGWTSLVYLDVDENAGLSPGDVILTDQTLAVGEELRILVRIFAPVSVAYGIQDETQVEAVGYADDAAPGCSGALLTSEVEDISTTANTDMVISKKQAIDTDCDGVADGADGNTNPLAPFALDRFTVLPGQCVVYRLDATNQGVAPLFNARVIDGTPPFTKYNKLSEACYSQDAAACTFISAPLNGATNAVIEVQSAEVGPSGVVTVFFGIEIE